MTTYRIVLEGAIVDQAKTTIKMPLNKPIEMSFEAESREQAQVFVDDVNQTTMSGQWRLIEPEPIQ